MGEGAVTGACQVRGVTVPDGAIPVYNNNSIKKVRVVDGDTANYIGDVCYALGLIPDNGKIKRTKIPAEQFAQVRELFFNADDSDSEYLYFKVKVTEQMINQLSIPPALKATLIEELRKATHECSSRFQGINTTETRKDQTGSDEAKKALDDYLRGKIVWVVFQHDAQGQVVRDSYGRGITETLITEDPNTHEMVDVFLALASNGWALPYFITPPPRADQILACVDEAQAAGRGIWKTSAFSPNIDLFITSFHPSGKKNIGSAPDTVQPHPSWEYFRVTALKSGIDLADYVVENHSTGQIYELPHLILNEGDTFIINSWTGEGGTVGEPRVERGPDGEIIVYLGSGNSLWPDNGSQVVLRRKSDCVVQSEWTSRKNYTPPSWRNECRPERRAPER